VIEQLLWTPGIQPG